MGIEFRRRRGAAPAATKSPPPDKWGFSYLEVGEAFDVPFSALAYHSLQAIKSVWGKKLNRNFSVRTISDERVYEVSRLPGAYGDSRRNKEYETPEVKKARPR